MKINRKLILPINNQRGLTAVIVAIAIVMLIGFVALAVDIGYIAATKNELQNVADAAALAGAGELGNQNLTTPGSIIETQIRDVAIAAGHENKAARLLITIDDNDVEIGTWDRDATPQFNNSPPSGTLLTAVKVTARRDSDSKSTEGPITTFFAKIFGIDTADVRADAVASLSGPNEVGEIELPIGISNAWFPDKCGSVVDFTDTRDSCVGWHNFTESPTTPNMADTILGIILGDEDCGGVLCPDGQYYGQDYWNNDPVLSAIDPSKVPDPFDSGTVTDAEDFDYTGGTVGALFLATGGLPPPMPTLFEYKKTRDNIPDEVNAILQREGHLDTDLTWTTLAPVYLDTAAPPDCMNPSGDISIEGFAVVQVFNVNPQPSMTMDVWIYCELLTWEGRGGGSTTGNVVGNIPNLVE